VSNDFAISIIASALGVRPEEVDEQAALNHHPAWDSLAQVHVILALEERLGISIDDSTVLQYSSVKAIAALCAQHGAPRTDHR
jgi:acyl carrier protein